MELYLLRHGDAEDKKAGERDEDRALTESGREQIRKAAELLKKGKVEAGLILTSPLLRARQTAEIVSKILNYDDEVKELNALIVGSSPEKLLGELSKYSKVENVVVVGHQPHLAHCIAYLTGEDEGKLTIEKGACCLVSLPSIGKAKGELRWIKRP